MDICHDLLHKGISENLTRQIDFFLKKSQLRAVGGVRWCGLQSRRAEETSKQQGARGGSMGKSRFTTCLCILILAGVAILGVFMYVTPILWSMQA